MFSRWRRRVGQQQAANLHRRAVLAACLILTVVSVFSAPAAGADERDRQARTFPAQPVRPFEIRVTVGDVEVRGEDRHDISVTVERAAPAGPLATVLPLVVDEADDRVLVSIVQPDEGKDAHVRGKVVVLAPRATPIKVDVFEGHVSVSGWRGPLQAKVERGGIDGTDVAGVVRMETTSGDIRLDRADLPAEGLLRLRTFNGQVAVSLVRAPANARVLLLTLNGAITSDLPVTERAGFGPRFREGTFGDAKPLLSVDAVRGDIEIRVGK